MAEEIKYTEKELKQPDRFVSAIESGVNFAGDHSRVLLAIVGSVIIILLGAYFINTGAEKNLYEANEVFNEAMDAYSLGNQEEALAKFEETATTYSGEPISDLATYYSGMINYNMGNFDKSREQLSAFLASDVNDRMLRDSALLTQGLSSYSEGNWEQAIQYLSQMQTGAGSPYEAMGQLHLAFSYQRSGQPDKAQDVYKNMYESTPGFNPSSLADRQFNEPSGQN